MTDKDMTAPARYNAIVLAAARGPDDAMAKSFSARHKCLIEVAGTPMIIRVLNVLRSNPLIDRIAISIDQPELLPKAAGWDKLPTKRRIRPVLSADRIADSLVQAIEQAKLSYPILITTGDHALLTDDMITHFCTTSGFTGADVTAGVAHEDVILGAYPDTRRTFFKFSDGRYSGCNMFALLSPRGLNAVRYWQSVQDDRKRPWRIFKRLGWGPLGSYLKGNYSLDDAVGQASELMDAHIQTVRVPFADAAIDVDTPADKDLAEKILRLREASAGMMDLDLTARAEPEEPEHEEKPEQAATPDTTDGPRRPVKPARKPRKAKTKAKAKD
jgi:GTP:adenosylcobinamide-phosphate guanylyltransferase